MNNIILPFISGVIPVIDLNTTSLIFNKFAKKEAKK